MSNETPVRRDQENEGKHIAILGLGPSVEQYLEMTKRAGGRRWLFDEVWCINALGNIFECDLIFHMDDVRIQEIRAAAKPQSNIAAMLAWLKTTKTPVMTSRPHEDYPALIPFPLEDALNILGHDYYNNTGAYAIAYAIMQGAGKISLFGMDYTYSNTHKAERGRACVEFWLGYAHALGIKINLPASTSLMDAFHDRESRIYGYDTVKIHFNMQDDGCVRLGFEDVERLPTAEEIEKSYDHGTPIAEQHVRIKVTE